MSNTHNQTDREPVPTEFAVTLKALRTIAWAAGEVKTRAAIEDILANGIPPARASVKAARAADVDAATPASAAEAVPVARLKVYMDNTTWGKALRQTRRTKWLRLMRSKSVDAARESQTRRNMASKGSEALCMGSIRTVCQTLRVLACRSAALCWSSDQPSTQMAFAKATGAQP